MTTFIGFDLHRAQITYDALNTDSGEVRTGRIRPANRDTVRAFLARYTASLVIRPTSGIGVTGTSGPAVRLWARCLRSDSSSTWSLPTAGDVLNGP